MKILPVTHHYEVRVDNVGVVHRGTDRRVARAEYKRYVYLSQLGSGRVAHEPVNLVTDGELDPAWEYIPDYQPDPYS
jgi:hypothetical protein